MAVSNSQPPLPYPRNIILLFAVIGALFLGACESTTRVLPQYEPPLARTDFQTVRTTAYTHTESDHRQYSNRNALGGVLRSAGPAIRRAENVRTRSDSSAPLQPFSMDSSSARTTGTTPIRYDLGGPTNYGSAAADWSRWPAGTIFRVLSTGQIYRVEDYGWALAGRNTIDLYMANSRDMNSWGVRQEAIEVLRWGDPQDSLRFLAPRREHRHIKRMVLELQGRAQEAAQLR